MSTVELGHGYFIEIDPLNYTLKERYSGKTKNGSEKESVRTCGYYGNIKDAVRRFVTLVRMDSMEDMVFSMHEYIEAMEQHENEIMDELKQLFGNYPVK